MRGGGKRRWFGRRGGRLEVSIRWVVEIERGGHRGETYPGDKHTGRAYKRRLAPFSRQTTWTRPGPGLTRVEKLTSAPFVHLTSTSYSFPSLTASISTSAWSFASLGVESSYVSAHITDTEERMRKSSSREVSEVSAKLCEGVGR